MNPLNVQFSCKSPATNQQVIERLNELENTIYNPSYRNKRVISIITSPMPVINVNKTDVFLITALSEAASFIAPIGTPTDQQQVIVRIKDNGTAQSLSWDSIFRDSSDLPLPNTTIVGKTLYLGFQYNLTDNKWDLLALLNNSS